MKFLKIFFIGLMILIALSLIGAVVFLKTFDANRYKPQIIDGLKNSLARPVDFSRIDLKLSLSQGISFNLKDFVIQDDPAFQTGALFKVGEVNIAVNVLDFLTKKQVSVPTVKIDSPQIVVVQLKDGRMNVTSLGEKTSSSPTSSKPATSAPSTTPTPPALNPAAALPAVLIQSIQIENANLSYSDQSFDPPISVAVSGLDLRVDHFSLTEPFPFQLKGSVFSSNENFQVDGKLQILLPTNQLKLSQVKCSTDLSKFSLLQLKESLPMLKQSPLPETLTGDLQLTIKELMAGAAGVSSASIDVGLEDAGVSFKEIAPGIPLRVNQLSVSIKGFSLKDSFPFKIQMALYSPNPNVFIDGRAQMDLTKQSAQLKKVEVSSELSTLDLVLIEKSIQTIKGLDIVEQLKGKLSIEMDQLDVGPTGLGKIFASASLSDGLIKMKPLAKPIAAIKSEVTVSGFDATLENFSAKLGKGSFLANGKLQDYMGKQTFSADVKLDAIDLSQVLEQKDLPARVEGIVQGSLQLQGAGLTPEALRKSLTGQGTMDVTQGQLKDINILKAVVSGISSASVIPLPNFYEVIESSLPPKYKEQLTQKDTILKKVSFITQVKDGKILISPAEVESEQFLFSANGEVGFDQKYALEGSFFISKELSAEMARGTQELQYLFDDQERVLIPLKITGEGPKISVLPDYQYIAKKMIVSRGKSELEKVLNKVFDKEETPSNSTDGAAPADEDSPASDDQQKRPEQKLLENILDKVFK